MRHADLVATRDQDLPQDILLAALAQWAFWWVLIPALVTVAVCFGIRSARLRRLHEAVLAAARSALSEASDPSWSHT